MTDDNHGSSISLSCPASLALINPLPNKRHAPECGALPARRGEHREVDGSNSLVVVNTDKSARMLPRYYGVWMPVELREKDNIDMPIVKTDYNEVWEMLKICKPARFKTFFTSEAAERFSLLPQAEIVSQLDHAAKLHTSNEAPAAAYFPTPNNSELNSFATLLDTDDADEMHRILVANPRYIVTKEDHIVKYRGSWKLTILNKAAIQNAHNCLRAILALLEDTKFYESFYPDLAKDDIRHVRDNVLAMNLNGQHNRFGNTTLHFAVENGAEDCVNLLTMHPCTNVTLRNKEGYLASDEQIICKECPEKTGAKKRIIEMLLPRYIVPITAPLNAFCCEANGSSKRAVDAEENDQFSIHTPMTFREACELNRRIIAYMGPISDEHNAYKFFIDVKKAVNSTGGHQMRREDSFKGVERVARLLATENNLPWSEKWEFLSDRFTPLFDLQSPEALTKVERHFARRCTDDKGRRIGSRPNCTMTAPSKTTLSTTSQATTAEPSCSLLTKSQLTSPLATSSPLAGTANSVTSGKSSATFYAGSSSSSPVSQRRLDFGADIDKSQTESDSSGITALEGDDQSIFEVMQDISGVFNDLTMATSAAEQQRFLDVQSNFADSIKISHDKAVRRMMEEQISAQLSSILNLNDDAGTTSQIRERETERFFTPPESPSQARSYIYADLIDEDDDDDLPFYDAEKDPSLLLDDDHVSIESSFVLGDEPSDVDRSLYYALTDNVNASTAHVLSKAKTYPHLLSWMSKVEKVEKLSPSPNRLQSSGIIYDQRKRLSTETDNEHDEPIKQTSSSQPSMLPPPPPPPPPLAFSPFSVKRFPLTTSRNSSSTSTNAIFSEKLAANDSRSNNMLWGLLATPPRKPNTSALSFSQPPVQMRK